MSNKDYTRLPTSESASEDLEDKEKATWQRATRRVVTSSFIVVMATCLGVAVVVLAVSWCTRTTSTSARPCESLAVRLEWRDLNREEKREYLRVVSCLRKRPSRLGLNQTLYDDSPYFHTRTGEDGKPRSSNDTPSGLICATAHYTASFLAWHRRFLYIYETTLQQQCGYKGNLTYVIFQIGCAERNADPWKHDRYWNWNLDWENVTRAPVWDAELGFGGNGNKSDSPGFRGFCVTDGAFSRLKLPFIGPMHIPHCLSRSFPSAENLTRYAQRIRPEAMQEVLNASTYDEFSSRLEEGPHLAIPFTIHGDFSVPTAPQGISSSGHSYRG